MPRSPRVGNKAQYKYYSSAKDGEDSRVTLLVGGEEAVEGTWMEITKLFTPGKSEFLRCCM